MPKYVIKATVTKTITADSEEDAHEQFSVLCDDEDERYEQETVQVLEDDE